MKRLITFIEKSIKMNDSDEEANFDFRSDLTEAALDDLVTKLTLQSTVNSTIFPMLI